MKLYLVYIIGMIMVVLLGAFIARYMTAKIAGFRPRYTKVLISTIAAYLVMNVAVLVFYKLGAFGNPSKIPSVVAGWVALTCAHINLVRSDTGDSLSPGQAIIVAFCQIIGAGVVLVPFVWLVFFCERALA